MAAFDVVIIGSGAGGAPIAHTLVRAGKSVLVLEKGPLLRPQYQTADGLSDFKRDELFSTGPEKRLHDRRPRQQRRDRSTPATSSRT